MSSNVICDGWGRKQGVGKWEKASNRTLRLETSSKRSRPRDRTPVKAYPHCQATTGGENARLASSYLTCSLPSISPTHTLYNTRINFAKSRSGRNILLECHGHMRKNAFAPVSRSLYCSQSAGVATSRYPSLFWAKNTQHLLSKLPRCQRSTSELDNRYATPKFNTHHKLLNKS